MIFVIQKVVDAAQIDPKQENVLFLFSTTKGILSCWIQT